MCKYFYMFLVAVFVMKNAVTMNYKCVFDSGRYHWVSVNSEKRVSIDDILKAEYVYYYRKLPSTEQDFTRYYDEFYNSSENQLIYLSDFWCPKERTSVDLQYSCLNTDDFEKWVLTVKPFIEMVKQKEDNYFKSSVLAPYIASWKTTFNKQKEHYKINATIIQSFNSLLEI